MNAKASIRPYLRLALYVAAVVLINVVGMTLFFRLDLTQNGVYSLSSVSKTVVSTLSEPLTINVFFTKDLPAPHNGTERYLRDLLEEYAQNANRFFNYKFYDVSPESESLDPSAAANRKLASDYGVHPVQIQIVENDEIKFKKAYMGLVIIHGDVIERIPAITSTAGLEYKLTTAMQKLNDKISALLALKDKVQVKLVMSKSLAAIAPYMGLDEMPRLPEEIASVVKRLNAANYDRLAFEYIDPATPGDQEAAVKTYNVQALEWPAIKEAGIAAGRGVIGLVMEHGGERLQLPLLSAMQIPIIGTRYQLADKAQLEENLTAALEKVVNINENLGLLTSHGSLSTTPAPGQQTGGIGNFSRLVSGTYNLKHIDLAKEDIPAGLKSLVIARPTQPLSDAERYQIDQALMRGTNLILFVDAFEEVMPQQRMGMGMNQGPEYRPLETGIETLLAHYGLTIDKAYVLDENCYTQQVPRAMGGGERKIYFAPMIQNRHINHDLDFMKNIRGLVAVKASPLTVDETALNSQSARAHVVFSSSDRSWEMKDRINLNPMFMAPPQSGTDMRSYPLAYLLEGAFTSYFAGKPVPTRTLDQPKDEQAESAENAPAKRDLSMIQERGGFIEKGKPARIFVLAASEMIRDNVLDAEDNTPNGVFIMNVIDALNGRSDIAVMRGKQQQFNPLDETSAATKAAVKWANIAGLPVLVVLLGIVVWIRRSAKRKRIQAAFSAGR